MEWRQVWRPEARRICVRIMDIRTTSRFVQMWTCESQSICIDAGMECYNGAWEGLDRWH